MVAVPVRTEPFFESGVPVVLFERQYDLSATTGGDRHYDVAPDGRRFLMVTEGSASSIHLVLNWFDEVNRLAPKND